MGEVYRARDATLQREVAIKVLPEVFTEDEDRLGRFEREPTILASLNHPHIAQIYGVASDGATRGLVMELVEGETLAGRIQRGPVPVEQTLAIARQLADALDAAHEQGIVHRDRKPANVKLTLDGLVKVLDFGLAKPNVGTNGGTDSANSPTGANRGRLPRPPLAARLVALKLLPPVAANDTELGGASGATEVIALMSSALTPSFHPPCFPIGRFANGDRAIGWSRRRQTCRRDTGVNPALTRAANRSARSSSKYPTSRASNGLPWLYPPTTNSWLMLSRSFGHAVLRSPGSYHDPRRFATRPSSFSRRAASMMSSSSPASGCDSSTPDS
jgi:serine/threonine protein kinase